MVACGYYSGNSEDISCRKLRSAPFDEVKACALCRWQVLRFITLPSLKPILLINVIMATSGTLNHIDIPLALTGGGPGRATEVLALSLYNQGFQVLDAAYASTIATVILALNLVLTVAYLRVLRGRNDRVA